ncbi:MAG: hypothetical protein COA45_00585 [Zetaproteobacteria bacterium]|nr:MAG: hypothetical protein COA45_00585 [Zetaproteobacteria bacterium]
MYFFRDKKLAKDLRNNAVTEKQTVFYFLVMSLFSTVAASGIVSFYMWSSRQYLTTVDYTYDAFVVIFLILSLTACYKINSKGNNTNFITRYICLSLPITSKTILFSILLVIPAFSYSLMTGPSLEELEAMDPNIQIEMSAAAELLFIGSQALTYLYAYWRYVTCFKIASGQKEYK